MVMVPQATLPPAPRARLVPEKGTQYSLTSGDPFVIVGPMIEAPNYAWFDRIGNRVNRRRKWRITENKAGMTPFYRPDHTTCPGYFDYLFWRLKVQNVWQNQRNRAKH